MVPQGQFMVFMILLVRPAVTTCPLFCATSGWFTHLIFIKRYRLTYLMIDCGNALFPTTSARPFRTEMGGNNFCCDYIIITTTIFTVHRVMFEIKTFATIKPFWDHVLITSPIKLVIGRVAQGRLSGEIGAVRGALGVHDRLLCPEICHRGAALSNERTAGSRGKRDLGRLAPCQR